MATVLRSSEQAVYKRTGIFALFTKYILFIIVCPSGHLWRSEDNVFSPTMWVLATKLRVSGLVASPFTLYSISKVHHFVAQTGLEHAILLLQPFQCRDYGPASCHNILSKRQPEPKT